MNEEAWKGPPRPSFLTAMVENAADFFSPRCLILLGATVIGCLIYRGFATPVLVQRTSKSKVTRANGDLRHIADQVLLFGMEQKRLPRNMAELVDRPADVKDWPEGGYLEKLPKDPWGGDYALVVSAQKPQDFDVISLGADNVPGGDEFDADLHLQEDLR
ncbi:MAG: hypothetical protein FD180_893 [Planctomycetota bacterium]|nr:MAG: hypothetical protein FD180_893 [Planctomycetota bacterium]